MVTFVCSYCDTTLKKKQCESHVRGRCRPGSLICIDCHKTFYNNEFKDHNSCITQQQKHWGQFAPQKKQKKTNQQANHQSKQSKQQEKKIQTNQIAQASLEQKQQQKNTLSDWKGWKNELKEIIKNNDNKIQLESLKKKALKRYKKKTGQEVSGELVEQKIGKIKKIRKQVYVSLDE